MNHRILKVCLLLSLLLGVGGATCSAQMQQSVVNSPAPTSSGGIALVGSATHGCAGSPCSVTYTSGSGHKIIVFVASSSTNAIYTIADSGGSSYTPGFNGACPSLLNQCAMSYTCSSVASTTITASLASGTASDDAIIVAEFSGGVGSGCNDQLDSTGTEASGTTASSNPLTTTAANEVVLGFFDSPASGVTFSTNGSYTLLQTAAHDGAGACGMTYRIVSSAGTYTPAATLSASNFWSGEAITLK
jgi:hypothetical protein